MQEIEAVANPDWIKYALILIGFLSAIVNSLIVYIFIDLKTGVKEIDKKVDDHRDRIIKLEAKNDV